MTTLEAIKQSLAHHEDNVRNLEGGKKFRVACIDNCFLVDGKEVWYDDNHCALCQLFPGGCDPCPLSLYGGWCGRPRSAWMQISDATSLPEALSAERNMVKVLKEVMRKYKEGGLRMTNQKELAECNGTGRVGKGE